MNKFKLVKFIKKFNINLLNIFILVFDITIFCLVYNFYHSPYVDVIKDKNYVFNNRYDNKVPICGGWVKLKNSWHYVDKNFHFVKNDFVKENGNVYYVNKDGSLLINKEFVVNGKKYKSDKNGVIVNFDKK